MCTLKFKIFIITFLILIKVHSYLYSFVPFGVLLVVNVLLIRVMRQKIRDLAGSSFISKKRQFSISLSVMLMTVLFILFTCPSAICSQLINYLITSYRGQLILSGFGCFSFSYHAFNLVILCSLNKHFYKIFKEELVCGKTTENAKFNNNLGIAVVDTSFAMWISQTFKINLLL